MNIKKFSPWNWFHDEKATGENNPIRTSQNQLISTNPLLQLHSEMDRLFDNVFQNFPGMIGNNWEWPEFSSVMLAPSIDIKDTDDRYLINVEIPGVAKENVDIRVEGNTLTISGEKKQEKKDEKENYHCIERRYGAFERTLTLPQDANADDIDAKFKDGVLTVSIKRKAVSVPKQTKKIEVKAA
jgi:HSP20 family protein